MPVSTSLRSKSGNTDSGHQVVKLKGENLVWASKKAGLANLDKSQEMPMTNAIQIFSKQAHVSTTKVQSRSVIHETKKFTK